MRMAKRTDDNHKALVEEVRKWLPGCTVFDASGAGSGFPDLVVGWKGRNYLFEVKDPDKPTSRRKLTGAQEKFHAAWQGQVAVVHTATELVARIALEARNG